MKSCPHSQPKVGTCGVCPRFHVAARFTRESPDGFNCDRHLLRRKASDPECQQQGRPPTLPPDQGRLL